MAQMVMLSPSLGGQTHQCHRLRPASRSREGGEGRGDRMPQGTRTLGDGWGCWGCAVSSKNGLSWSKSLKSLKFISLLYTFVSFSVKGYPGIPIKHDPKSRP